MDVDKQLLACLTPLRRVKQSDKKYFHPSEVDKMMTTFGWERRHGSYRS